MANKCGSCGKFTSAIDSTKCRNCSLVFHRGCLVNTSPNASAPKLMCKGCKSSAANTDASGDADSLGSVAAVMKAIELLRTELSACTREMSSFRQELGVIRTTLVDFNTRMDSFDERLSKLEKRENPVESIDETLSQLRSDLNDRDQELLLNDVEITGVLERDGENLMDVVSLISNKLGVNIDEREVVSVQRAGHLRARAQSTSERPPPARAICVRLARRGLRDELLRAARVRRGADTAGFDNDAQPRRFYVNERLTRVNRQLFYAVRAKAKELGWRVEISVTRLGGGYGGKASRSALTACACALVAHALGRGASLVLPLTHNMAAIGKRQAARFEYEVGVNDEGVIQHADVVFYSDNGITHNESGVGGIASVMGNLYDISKWNIRGYDVLTDKASNTWCRAPSSTEGTAIVEHIMERISYITKKDPIDVRKVNIAPKHDVLKDMIDTFKIESNYDERRAEIEKYNNENAWKKKGLKLTIMSFPVEYHGSHNVTISVYHVDGTILISHGGIEMGQGINTKTAQVCAYTLKVPLDMVKVKGSNNFVAPNNIASAGSVASESVAFATIRACKELLKRLEPLKEELNEPTWVEVVKSAHSKGINLQATAMMSTSDNLPTYDVYGVCAAEVLLDVLTGTHIVSRVDLVEDTGRSLNPNVDVGQIEGSFIMGLGLWTTEQLIYDPSGRLLTNRTWSYRPPGACDIPVDFRVSFTRKSANTIGVLRSKATGEPALLLSVVVTFALHEAIFEARKEYGYNDTEWVHVDTPYCVDNIIKAISPNIKSYKLN